MTYDNLSCRSIWVHINLIAVHERADLLDTHCVLVLLCACVSNVEVLEVVENCGYLCRNYDEVC